MQSIQIAASELWITMVFLGILILFWKDLEKNKVTKALLFVCILRLLSDAISWGFDGTPGLFWGIVTRISNYLTFVSNNLVSAVFALFIWGEVKRDDEKMDVVLGIYLAAECISIASLTIGAFFGWFYSFDANNLYSRGPYHPLTHITPIMALFVVLWLMIRYHQRFRTGHRALAWTYLLVMSTATIYDYLEFGLSLQTYSQTFSAMAAFFMGELDIRRDLEKTKENLEAANENLSRAKDEAEAANKAKSTFLFNMSHDIRTPMNAIVGYTELLIKNPEEEKRKDYLEKIRLSSDFLLSLINNVLEMARIESNNIALDESPSLLGSVQNEVKAVYSELMARKNIEFIVSSDFQNKYVYLDKVLAKSILLNIVSNAYKYTPEGGRVSFSIHELPSDREGYIMLEAKVSDSGIGMSKEYLPKLFDEFSRDRTAYSSQIQGTGLGMPIVKRLVEKMGGIIEADSTLGKGTVITIHLPLRKAPPPEEILEGKESTKERSFELELSNQMQLL